MFSTGVLPNLICIAALLLASSFWLQVEARKHHHSKSLNIKCQGKECELSAPHFALYSTVKRALDGGFDLSGKEIVPLLRSIGILQKRFQHGKTRTRTQPLNGNDLIRDLLNNRTLNDALEAFNSDEGRGLISFYRASISGRGQNLACSNQRAEDLRRAANRIRNPTFMAAFGKIHENYSRKSAKKCLKQACTSIDLAMTRLDSVVLSQKSPYSTGGRRKSAHHHHHHSSESLETNSINVNDNNNNLVDSPVASSIDQQQAGAVNSTTTREFQPEELALCKFFKKTNEENCTISGAEMSNLTFIMKTEPPIDHPIEGETLGEHLKIYSQKNMPAQATLEEALGEVYGQCETLEPMLTYNLDGIEFYLFNNLITQEQLDSRAFWCKGLAYWVEMDRLCGNIRYRMRQIKDSKAND